MTDWFQRDGIRFAYDMVAKVYRSSCVMAWVATAISREIYAA